MVAFPILLMLVSAAMPPAEVSTLNGEQHVGSLDRLTPDELTLKTPTGNLSIPNKELLTIRLTGAQPATSASTPVAPQAPCDIRLIDGSRLRVTNFTCTTKQINLQHPKLGAIAIPLATVQSIRLAPADVKVDAAWNRMLEKAPKKDQVAVRKSDVLDHLDGVIGSLDDNTLNFQLDGDDIPIKRERVFGLIFSKRESAASKVLVTVDLATGDHLAARTVGVEADVCKVKLASGNEFAVPLSDIEHIDFSPGKIAYLSNLEPRDVKYTPYFEFVWEYRRDRGVNGRPISVGNRTYPKGLAIHSVTMLKYRIGGDYRQFQCMMGIDDAIISGGNVDVVIKGDGRVLFKGSVRQGQSPQPLDLDVTGVVELEIAVGYGEDELDIGDWLHLGDAKVVR